MPPKRKSDATTTAEASSAKKARTSESSSTSSLALILSQGKETLINLPSTTLVQYITELQSAYLFLSAHPAPRPATPIAASSTFAVDPAKIGKQASKLADMMAKGIKKQMKWQPSCKKSGKRWTYSSMVPSHAVFYSLFNIKEADQKKAWKQKKIPLEDFEEITGELEASTRFGSLIILSKEITLKWDRDDNSFTVSGLYGLPPS